MLRDTNGSSRSWKIILGQLITVMAILAAMEITVGKGIISDLYLASPSEIVNEFIVFFHKAEFFRSIWITFMEFLVGFIISIVSGIGFGIIIATIPAVEKFCMPFVSAVMAIPKVALVPLLTIWLGIGYSGKVFFVIISCFFPILFNTIVGVKETSDNHLKVARVFEAKKEQIIMKVFLPSATPTIFAGIRVAAAGGLMGALFSEIMGSKEGLGNLMTKASQLYQTGQLFALIIVVTLISVVIIHSVELLERKVFLKWQSK